MHKHITCLHTDLMAFQKHTITDTDDECTNSRSVFDFLELPLTTNPCQHCKKKKVALTQLGLSQLQVHYPTMCIQALSWVKAPVLFLQ